MKKINSLPARICIGIAIPTIIIILLVYVYYRGSPFFCVFYHFTGLYCFGCGSGRALTSLLHFNLINALRNNFFACFAFPYLAYQLGAIYFNYISGRKKLKLINLNFYIATGMIIVLLVFVVLRNIPISVFDFLRPLEK